MLIRALKDYRDMKGDPGSSECVAHLKGFLDAVLLPYLLVILAATAIFGFWVPVLLNEFYLPHRFPQYKMIVDTLFLVGVFIFGGLIMLYVAEYWYFSNRRRVILQRPPGYILFALYDAMALNGDVYNRYGPVRHQAVEVVSENVDWLLNVASPRLRSEMPRYLFKLGLMMTVLPRDAQWPEVESLHKKIMELDLCRDAKPSRWYKFIWRIRRIDTELVNWVLARWGE